ncbi:MAG: hypothetical protein ACTHKG_18760 [Nocardioides sp.]
MLMSEIVLAGTPYASAELGYREERARHGFARTRGPRRRWLPRRPTLKLPEQRRRPVAVA